MSSYQLDKNDEETFEQICLNNPRADHWINCVAATRLDPSCDVESWVRFLMAATAECYRQGLRDGKDEQA